MSEENVERVRESVDALNRGDVETALALAHPDVEWQTLDVFPDARTYRGAEEVQGFFETWHDSFRGFRLHLERCEALGDNHVLAALRVSGAGAESGVEVKSPLFFQVLEYGDGRLIRAQMFQTEAEALQAVGPRP